MTSPEITDAAVEALLPCPFCGGEAERVDIEDGDNAGGSCVCCKQCLASSNVEFGFKENFVSNWNRRAALPHLAAGRAEAAPIERDTLGRMVREAWVRWAHTQPSPKPSWLVPYDELAEPDKEADRQIGEAIAKLTVIHYEASRAGRAEAVAVKPLEFSEHKALDGRRKLVAYDVFGHEYASLDLHEKTNEKTIAGFKALSQRVYDGRIRSALVSAPAAEAEPVAWQWNNLGTWHTVECGPQIDAEKYVRSVAGAHGRVRPIWTAAPSASQEALREALCNARDFIESSAFNIPTKDYFDAVLREIDAAIALSTAPSAPSERARDFWLQYDHQVGRWCVENKPPKVIRTGAEVIHTREVVASPSSKDVLREALIQSWIDFLDANPDDLTSPEDLPDHALMTCEQFIAYSLAALAQSAPVKEGE